ncbi:hypothetical protein EYW49_08985 [Siculibacillus lacustris]|uniref:Uncharacterized protein n=1 Tax=Siculibacillus lacustris TaxID=1549641 RepID=A0A4Q9VSC3_9HYPH|nr:hypothetical protein [Siculibacillus lacustris]TBW38396.1 hypothetical protein EYW49_08985 [Siculibacillus lacustris]
MKRQARPFIVEIKQRRNGAGKSVPNPLWSGHDLLLLKEAQPEARDEVLVAAAPELVVAKVILPARILSATVSPLSIDAPEGGPVPAKPRKSRIPKPSAMPVVVTPPEPNRAPRSSIRLRDRSADALPRGQRWKRRLPKIIR